MISIAHRFHGHNSLNFVYRHGDTVRGPLCALKYALNERRSTYRVAVVVSKKVSKSAVVRNRIRRRLYEQVRLNQVKIIKPYDIVISVFSEDLATIPANEVALLVNAQLKQAQILK